MPAKKKVVDDEEEDDDLEFEDDELDDEYFTCRVCKKQTAMGDGDDLIMLCDDCSENYDIDKIWEDFDDEKILEENLTKFDLSQYILKKAPKKAAKKPAKKK